MKADLVALDLQEKQKMGGQVQCGWWVIRLSCLGECGTGEGYLGGEVVGGSCVG